MEFSKILIMAILVSIDAFFVGMLIGSLQKLTFKKYVISVLTIITIVLIGYFLALIIRQFYELDLRYISAIVFIIFGARNLFKKKDDEIVILSTKSLIFLNVALSLDGAIATFSSAFIDASFIIPLTICVVHFILLFLGWILSHNLNSKFKSYDRISGLCLLVLGILKIFNLV